MYEMPVFQGTRLRSHTPSLEWLCGCPAGYTSSVARSMRVKKSVADLFCFDFFKIVLWKPGSRGLGRRQAKPNKP
jgi:hypothetical protein